MGNAVDARCSVHGGTWNGGQRPEQVAGWTDAGRLPRRAIEVDLLAEGLHRALMESLLAQRRSAAVVEAYERPVGLLRAELDVRPSRATQAVVARARAAL